MNEIHPFTQSMSNSALDTDRKSRSRSHSPIDGRFP